MQWRPDGCARPIPAMAASLPLRNSRGPSPLPVPPGTFDDALPIAGPNGAGTKQWQ
mgnify:CR=1 FL=1|jgi:hypothetical protein